MEIIEIDPTFFVTCRLCLDNLGVYQIVPSVQLQIKFCYDIEVDPFDRLPQLICKNCGSILSKYSEIKKNYVNKQKTLRNRLKIKADKSTSAPEPEQDPVSSTQLFTSVEGDKKDNNEVIICHSSSIKSADTGKTLITKGQNKKVKKLIKKQLPDSWEKKYEKWFRCRFCDKCCKTRCGMVKHINSHSSLLLKYLKCIDKHCSVKLNKIDNKQNLCNSERIVVHDLDTFIRSDDNLYYALYKKNRVLNISNDEVKNSLNETISVPNTDKSPESSDSEPVFKPNKRKRLRLISDETVILENDYDNNSSNFAEKTCKVNTLIIDNECINLDDSSDTASCKSVSSTDNHLNKNSLTPSNQVGCKIIQNIVSVCFKKYAKMLELGESDDMKNSTKKVDSSLKHKVLSFGRKIINNSGISCIGILRYLEHQNLDIVWIPRLSTQYNKKLYHVQVMIKLKIPEENDARDRGWTILQDLKNVLIDDQILEDISNAHPSMLDKDNSEERNVSVLSGQATLSTVNNIISEKDLILKKLLNANPVENPKQLRKKTNVLEIQCASVVTKAKEKDNPVEKPAHSVSPNETFLEFSDKDLHMPIITSTMSLAPFTTTNDINVQDNMNNQNVPLLLNKTTDCNSYANAIGENITNERGYVSNVNETHVSVQSAQWIKVKPVTELMSDRALYTMNRQNDLGSNIAINQSFSINLPHQNSSNIVFMANVGIPQLHSVAGTSQLPKPVETLPMLENNTSTKIINSDREFVLMDTVDLPHRKTDSPSKYFKMLLKMHNMTLLDTNEILSSDFHNLVKFKMCFSQDTNLPVVLNLGLYCSKPPQSAARFCIKVRDMKYNDIDISGLSAYWQWEMLKVFAGDDMVPKLLMNAQKVNQIVHDLAKIFVCLLKGIKFQKMS